MPRALRLIAPFVVCAAIMFARVALAGARSVEAEGPSDILERMARAKFGALSAAELTMVRAAPMKEFRWTTSNDDPSSPINDPANAAKWGPERSIRAGVIQWLASDPEAMRRVHPAGIGINAARITGKVDLTYLNVPFPILLARCAIGDGIDLSEATIQELDLRASITGPIDADMAEVKRDLVLRQRADGMIEDATSVMIAQRVAQRRHGGLRFAERAWNAILEVTIGYGFRPLRALWWMAAFVALGTILFRFGYDARMITPIEQSAYETFSETGEPPPFYPAFNAFVYSLDNFLPVVELHQCDYWRPNPLHRTKDGEGARPRVGSTILRWYLWVHILAGWTLMPLLFAGLSGLIRVE